ncbi:MAG: BNR repeat-containing protein, partial [Mycobacterium sp.]|nr:BNR repeat-containing protein [Mycobacterium sp.]
PAPPPTEPLVCTPVQGPPYTIPGTTWNVVDSSQVDLTNAKLGVAQPLLTHGDIQYVGYYNADQQMVIASRTVGSDTWTRQLLPESIGWDAHNSIGMAVDRDGQLHVAGDMHNVPLIYFRTTTAGDVTTLAKIASMVDPATENSMTYPVFLYNGDGALIYNYRNGGSGNGSSYYNIYDESTKTWSRLFDQPLFDGQGLYNSYPSAPALGPDGYFHMVWVWRDTADAATNSHLCYARSEDMVNWTTIAGDAIRLPIVYSTAGVLVDPVPNYGGLLNGAPKIGFDAKYQVLISYYKFDRQLNTQVYVARPLAGKGNAWGITQVSNWTGRYLAQGIGGIPGVPVVSPVSPLPDGNLQMQYNYVDQSGIWIMNPQTLIPFTEAQVPASLPAQITTLRSTFPGMQVQVRGDLGSSGSSDEKYVLRWEALPTNNDLPRNPPYPDPSPLQIYQLRSS